jgi:CHAT domain-containing protein/Flp pilus assembly protein TadD
MYKILAAVLVISAVVLGLDAQSPTVAPEKALALKLIAAETDDERASILGNEVALVNASLAREITAEANRLLGQVSSAESERISRIGLNIAEKVGDRLEIARALNSLGNAQQNKKEKLATYQRGLEISEEIDDQAMMGKFLYGIANLQDTWDKQIGFYERAVAVSEKAGETRTVAAAWGRIGNHYTQEGNYLTAREYHMKALALREQMNDLDGISITLSNIGILDTMQGDLNAALSNIRRSIEILERLGEKEGAGIDSYNLGNVYLLMGDHAQAMTLYMKSLRLFEEIDSGGGIEGVSTGIANLYIAQGNYEHARSYLDRAAKLHDKTGKEIPQYALGSYGDTYKGEGNFEKAIEYYQKLRALKEKGDNKDSLAETLVNIGNCYLLKPNAEKARENFERAFKLSESTGNQIWMFQSLIGLAETQLIEKQFSAALESANLARSHHEKLNRWREYWELYSVLGRAQRGLGQTEQARRNFEKAVSVVEDQRNRVAGGSSEKRGFFRDSISPYLLMVDMLVSHGSTVDALKYSEMVKARTLIDALQGEKVKIDRLLTPQESAREQRFRNELVSYRAQIERASGKNADPGVVAALQNQLATKRREFEDFRIRLNASHPELKTQRGEMKPIGMEETAALLPDERSALVEFAVAEDKTFLFVITKDAAQTPSLKAFNIDVKQKDLAGRVEAFRSKIAKGDLDFSKDAAGLYDLLVKPAVDQLKNKTNIVIVPDGPLWNLPFQTLQTASGKYLIEQAAVSYAPSLTALREMRKKNRGKKTSEASLLAFGNPAVNKETSDRLKTVFKDESLELLPEAERLVNTLGKMYGSARSSVYTGADAREQTAKTEVPKFRIVQFATHGILNNASPMYSHIVLSQKQDDPNEDGLLEAWEMKDLDLKADMVILSACDTARGRLSAGEGVIGMTWAMFIAGTPTTVASQWKVESSSTTELMLEFHRQLLSGKVSKAEALRRASLKLMNTSRYKHPSYWAGFVLIGDGS